jgi:hypothetical protein
VERATGVKPEFILGADNAAAVAAICRRLEGLPLAIELAAARVKVLPPVALLARLERRLPLLTSEGRELPARQQTMRDTIAWSHDLLAPEERTVFRRLAVFPGGGTIEAAEAVVGTESGLDVFAGITALVEKSLLRQEEGASGEPHFRMLETVREYGLECLDESGEGDPTRGRLAAWILALTEQAEPDAFGGAISPAWVDRLDEELPNVRTAVAWLLARGDAARALRLLVAAEDYWTQRHLTDAELHAWLPTALVAAPDAPARDRCRRADHAPARRAAWPRCAGVGGDERRRAAAALEGCGGRPRRRGVRRPMPSGTRGDANEPSSWESGCAAKSPSSGPSGSRGRAGGGPIRRSPLAATPRGARSTRRLNHPLAPPRRPQLLPGWS